MKYSRANMNGRGRALNKASANRQSDVEWMRREEFCKQAWLDYIKTNRLPDGIPTRPDIVYAGGGWKNWQDWIGMVDSIAEGAQP